MFNTRKQAVADANRRFKEFIDDETEGLTGIDRKEVVDDIGVDGDFRTGNIKELWTEEHSIKVIIREK